MHTGPPSISASTPFAPLAFDVGVSGRTDPGATVAVDGTPVPVAIDGRFDAAVSAGLWPRDVRIEATDPLGNRSSITVSDDGTGLREGPSEGVGLANIRAQLKARFADRASVALRSRESGGTIARLTLPIEGPKT